MTIADKIRKNQPNLFDKLVKKFNLNVPENKLLQYTPDEDEEAEFQMYKKLMEQKTGFKL